MLRLVYYATLYVPLMALRGLVNSLLVRLGLKLVVPTGPPVWRWRWRWWRP